MRDIRSQKFCGYLTYELFVSKAFRALKPSAKDILILLYYELDFTNAKRKRNKYVPYLRNRNNIKLPYREIKDRLGYSTKTTWEAFQQIMAHGFIDVVKNGGGCKGDYKIYKISEGWRKWKPGQVIHKIRTNGKVGWQKQKK